MGTAVKDLQSKSELDAAIQQGSPLILHFWATWCQASAHMDSVFAQLCTDNPLARFFRVEAEEQPEISEAFGVSAVPFFVFIKDGVVADKLEGANPAELASKAAHICGTPSQVKTPALSNLGMAAAPAVVAVVQDPVNENKSVVNGTAAFVLSEPLRARLQNMVDTNLVMLFMKGTPEQPRCGFSRKVVVVLNEVGAKYGSFDILSDDDVRQGLKIFSNWPTFPQLYCKGELLGGCDITLEMHKTGELKQIFVEKGVLPLVAATTENGSTEKSADETLLQEVKPDAVNVPEAEIAVAAEQSVDNSQVANGDKEGANEALNKRIEGLINSKPIMIFMKGTPEEPRCGFSRRAADALKEEGIEFGSFNILTDDDVRQGLKSYSNWPTFPQVYIEGELIGGCDIVTEMHANGELKQLLAEKGLVPKETIESRLKNIINSSPTMLFMKGTPDAPRCGFSSKVVTALKEEGVNFGSFDILSDDEVRQGLKTYSNWPTFPQLYHKGELIGGCDIVLEMQKSGELKTTLLA